MKQVEIESLVGRLLTQHKIHLVIFAPLGYLVHSQQVLLTKYSALVDIESPAVDRIPIVRIKGHRNSHEVATPAPQVDYVLLSASVKQPRCSRINPPKYKLGVVIINKLSAETMDADIRIRKAYRAQQQAD